MQDLLSNQAVQAALIVVIVTGLNALTTWLKQKFPTQAARVEANWCYLQPAVEYAMSVAKVSASEATGNATLYSSIIARALTQFADSYRGFEGKDVPTADLNAARNEIAAAVARVTGG